MRKPRVYGEPIAFPVLPLPWRGRIDSEPKVALPALEGDRIDGEPPPPGLLVESVAWILWFLNAIEEEGLDAGHYGLEAFPGLIASLVAEGYLCKSSTWLKKHETTDALWVLKLTPKGRTLLKTIK